MLPSPAPLTLHSLNNTRRLSGVHVLLVDDSEDLLALLALQLGRAGADISAVQSGQAALAAYRQQRPDIIICDLCMPEMDGFELLERILGDAGGGEAVPALGITGWHYSDCEQRAVGAGFKRLLYKPISSERLVTAVAQAMGRS